MIELPGERTHLHAVMVNGINAIQSQPQTDQDQNRFITPCLGPLAGCPLIGLISLIVEPPCARQIGRRVHVRLVDHAVCGSRYGQSGRRERIGQSPSYQPLARRARRKSTHFSAPAAVLGPNHSPTSFPNSLPIKAIRCTLKGHKGEGSSKNHDNIRT